MKLTWIEIKLNNGLSKFAAKIGERITVCVYPVMFGTFHGYWRIYLRFDDTMSFDCLDMPFDDKDKAMLKSEELVGYFK